MTSYRRLVLLAVILCWSWQNAMILRVLDGDTFEARIEISPRHEWVAMVRVLGVDTPELTGDTKAAALVAKAFTVAWLSQGPVTVTGCKNDSFGRFLGAVTRGDENLAQQLIVNGYGVPR